MTKTFPNLLEGPTYLTVRRYPDGEAWVDETKLNASLLDAITDIEGLTQVVMIEGSGGLGKAVDQSIEWIKHNL